MNRLLVVAVVVSIAVATVLVSHSFEEVTPYRAWGDNSILWYAGPGTKSDQHFTSIPPSCEHVSNPGDLVHVTYGWNRYFGLYYFTYRNTSGEGAADPSSSPLRYWVMIGVIVFIPIYVWAITFFVFGLISGKIRFRKKHLAPS